MAKPINYRIRIRTYSSQTRIIQTFESINSFLKKYKYDKMPSRILKCIRQGKIIRYKNYYVCKTPVGNLGKKVRRMISGNLKKIELKKLNDIKMNNEAIFDSAILILDKNLKIKSIFTGNLIELSEKKDIGYEALKSRVHRFKIMRDNFYNGKIKTISLMSDEHYCYLNDYVTKNRKQ